MTDTKKTTDKIIEDHTSRMDMAQLRAVLAMADEVVRNDGTHASAYVRLKATAAMELGLRVAREGEA